MTTERQHCVTRESILRRYLVSQKSIEIKQNVFTVVTTFLPVGFFRFVSLPIVSESVSFFQFFSSRRNNPFVSRGRSKARKGARCRLSGAPRLRACSRGRTKSKAIRPLTSPVPPNVAKRWGAVSFSHRSGYLLMSSRLEILVERVK